MEIVIQNYHEDTIDWDENDTFGDIFDDAPNGASRHPEMVCDNCHEWVKDPSSSYRKEDFPLQIDCKSCGEHIVIGLDDYIYEPFIEIYNHRLVWISSKSSGPHSALSCLDCECAYTQLDMEEIPDDRQMIAMLYQVGQFEGKGCDKPPLGERVKNIVF